MDPDLFRLNLNALIQALRNVTWLLQKQKRSLPGFSEWYTNWQERANEDDAMRWLIKARNRIVKEADLELYSRAKIRFSFDWNSEVSHTVSMPPHFSTHQIMRHLLATKPSVVSAGVLTVERIWIDRFLPGKELLDITSYIYSEIARLVRTAHEKKGVPDCDLVAHKRECMSPPLPNPICMVVRDEQRRSHVDLATYKSIREVNYLIERDEELLKVAKERYGEVKLEGEDAISMMPTAFEMAKRILSTGEDLMPVAWLTRGKDIVGAQSLSFSSPEAKRLAILNLASQVAQVGADGVLLSNETWYAGRPPKEHPEWERMPIRNRPDRREGILIAAATRDGRVGDILCLFSRDSKGLPKFEKEQYNAMALHPALDPIRRIWQRDT